MPRKIQSNCFFLIKKLLKFFFMKTLSDGSDIDLAEYLSDLNIDSDYEPEEMLTELEEEEIPVKKSHYLKYNIKQLLEVIGMCT